MNYPNPYEQQSQPNFPVHPYFMFRQQHLMGQATWTEGGKVTKCNIPWSDNEYMTAAVGDNTPYKCGQTLLIRNMSNQREVLVKVVDEVAGYPPNKINLHRKAFEALGANLDAGVITIEIIPSPNIEQEEWGRYLLAVTKVAYPGFMVTNYKFIDKKQISSTQTKQTYEYVLQSPRETIKVQGNVIYNPQTKRVISFDVKEI